MCVIWFDLIWFCLYIYQICRKAYLLFVAFFWFHVSVVETNSLPSDFSIRQKTLRAVCLLLMLRFIYRTENFWWSNTARHDSSSVLSQLANWRFFHWEVVDLSVTLLIRITSFINFAQFFISYLFLLFVEYRLKLSVFFIRFFVLWLRFFQDLPLLCCDSNRYIVFRQFYI